MIGLGIESKYTISVPGAFCLSEAPRSREAFKSHLNLLGIMGLDAGVVQWQNVSFPS
jgi:hypothetical protein